MSDPSNQPPPTMSDPQTINLTKFLAGDPRVSLEKWLEEIETHARNFCAQHDVTGALILVASDKVWWNSFPAHQANAAGVWHRSRRPFSISSPPNLGSTHRPRQQRCCCHRLSRQNEGGKACKLQQGRQYPHYCPIGWHRRQR